MPRSNAPQPSDPTSAPSFLTAQLERLVRSLIRVLAGLLVVALLINFARFGRDAFDPAVIGPLLGGLVLLWLATRLVERGRWRAATGVIVAGALAIQTQQLVGIGVIGTTGSLGLYLLPVAVAALLLSRRALLLTCAASVAAALALLLLQRADVPWVATRLLDRSGVFGLLTFTLTLVSLALILDRFGSAFYLALGRVARREQELTRVNADLQQEMEERAAAVREREEALAREREARAHAEASGERLAFLAEVGLLVSSSLDLDQTLAQITQLLVPRFADWCAIDLVNPEGQLQRLAAAHRDPEKVQWILELHDRYPVGPSTLPDSYASLEIGEPIVMNGITGETLRQATLNEEHRELLERVGVGSIVVLPLRNRGQVLGILTLAFLAPTRQYDEEQVRFAEELARRAAAAVDNARLYQREHTLNDELERRVAHRTAQLELARQEFEDFTYSASHDLRAPLRGINGFSKALLADYGDQLDEKARSYLERIAAGAQRLGMLMDDLLHLASIGRGQRTIRPVDLSRVAREVATDLRERSPDRRVEVVIEDGLVVQGEERLLELLLTNLFENSWKFTAPKPEARIEFGAFHQDGERVYFVRDNGVGFDMAYTNRLFAPFYRLHADQEFEGSGIGLATAERIVQRHGGRIWANAEVGVGATFYFTISEEQTVD